MSQHDDAAAPAALAEAAQETVGEYASAWWTRVRSGDLGSLPLIAGIIVIVIIFGFFSPETTDGRIAFFTERNFTNLMVQMAGLTTIAIGVVFVLLIAEIDLSVGFVSGVGGVVMVLLLRDGPGFPPGDVGYHWVVAIGIALAVTAAIGLLHGTIITKASVPSFIVTLAGFLAWSGVVLILTTELSTAGTIIIQDDFVVGIANNFLDDYWSWLLLAAVVVGFAAVKLAEVYGRRRAGVPHQPLVLIGARIAGLAAIGAAAVYYANKDRGVPVVAVILLVLLVFWTFVAGRTRFGRHVYAVGGNPEAARRAGINVDRVKIAVFMISSLMAGVGGLILASRLRSVDTATGSGNLLLNAIAAAVIGGTSLFGGSGRVVSALLGALVIASVDNGMGLLGLSAGVKFVVTGLVLLAAVVVDSFSRRGRAASGIA